MKKRKANQDRPLLRFVVFFKKDQAITYQNLIQNFKDVHEVYMNLAEGSREIEDCLVVSCRILPKHTSVLWIIKRTNTRGVNKSFVSLLPEHFRPPYYPTGFIVRCSFPVGKANMYEKDIYFKTFAQKIRQSLEACAAPDSKYCLWFTGLNGKPYGVISKEFNRRTPDKTVFVYLERYMDVPDLRIIVGIR